MFHRNFAYLWYKQCCWLEDQHFDDEDDEDSINKSSDDIIENVITANDEDDLDEGNDDYGIKISDIEIILNDWWYRQSIKHPRDYPTDNTTD